MPPCGYELWMKIHRKLHVLEREKGRIDRLHVEIVFRVQWEHPSSRSASSNMRLFCWTRYFADKNLVVRSHFTNDTESYPRVVSRQQEINCPASSTQLTINDRREWVEIFLWQLYNTKKWKLRSFSLSLLFFYED